MDDRAAPERDDHARLAPGPGADERSGRRRFRRAVTLLVLTLAVPGSAQYAAGNRRLGRIAIRCWLGVIAVLVLLAAVTLVHSAFLVRLLSSSSVLTFIRALCILAAIAWLALFVDAWRLGAPRMLRRNHRIASTGLAAGFSLFTAAGLLVSSQYVAVASTSLDSIFTSHVVSKAHEGRYNVMLLGGDAGADRVGLRPDSVTVASIDEGTGATVLFSLPRNLQKVPFADGSVMSRQFPNGFDCGTDCLLNAVYTWGSEHKDRWPAGADAGLDATRSAVEGITGLRVNYYALVDMSGFAKLINAVGGVDVNVKHALPIGPKDAPTSWITTGQHHLDGQEALWFARSRANTSDYDRVARQKCVMSAMLEQLDPKTVLRKFQGIAEAGRQIVSTDIPASELSTFLSLAQKAKAQKIRSVAFVPPLVVTAHPDYPKIRAKVASSIAASEAGAKATAGATPTATRTATPSSKATATPSSKAISTTRPKDSGVTGNPAPETDDLSAVCSAG
jgi:LCP family protein required for cell wall assembly